jgi:hypothetical protein
MTSRYRFLAIAASLLLPFTLLAQSLEVAFSMPPGFYTQPIQLELSVEDPAAVIYYTTDGGIPTLAAQPYQGPLALAERAGQPNVFSMIPTNNIAPGHPYREEWLPPQGEVFKIHLIRARAIRPDGAAGPIATASYIIDAAGNGRYSLPLVSLASAPDSLFGFEKGIYVPGITGGNFNQRGREWERELHFSLFEADGTLALAQDAGVRIHGGTSRNRPRKSLRLYARSDYGSSWFDYPLFPDKPVSRYKTFLLRNSGNDWSEAIFRDAYIQALIKENSSLDIQYSRPAVVFINGEYWGIHNFRDRFDDRYLQAHYGLDPERITILENDAVFDDGNPEGRQSYLDMYAFITQNSMADEANFAAAALLMDMDNYIDYLALQIYARNTDWPGNNLAYWRHLDGQPSPEASHPADGRWRWLAFDLDFGFALDFDYVLNSGSAFGPNTAFHQTLAFALAENGPAWPNPSWSTALFRSLIQNEGFRRRFVSRFADHLNTSFSRARALRLLDSLEQIYRPEMAEHIARWNQPTAAHWESELQRLRTFAQLRADLQRIQLDNRFGLGGSAPLAVDVAGKGQVQVNSVLLSTATAGVEAPIYPWQGQYFRGVPVTLVAIPEAGYAFSHWSGSATSEADTLTLWLGDDSALTAHFVPAAPFPGDEMNPPAHRLAEADYFWGFWSSTEPEGAFPPHIVFQQSSVNDPALLAEMTHPYFIPYIDENDNEYHQDDQDKIGFPYSLTGRTRIEGLGEDGIAFINTGRQRDLGTAVLALDTREAQNLRIDWKAETLLANSRTYHIRLQYRIGLQGTWRDVRDENGSIVEYQRTSAPQGEAQFEGIPFPADAYGQPYVQLRWKYYYTGIRLDPASGQRDKLRLDDIRVWQGEPSSASAPGAAAGARLFPSYPNPFQAAAVIPFALAEGSRVRLEVFDLQGRLWANLVDGYRAAGRHEQDFQCPHCPAGVYVYRLSTPGQTFSGRLVKK